MTGVRYENSPVSGTKTLWCQVYEILVPDMKILVSGMKILVSGMKILVSDMNTLRCQIKLSGFRYENSPMSESFRS